MALVSTTNPEAYIVQVWLTLFGLVLITLGPHVMANFHQGRGVGTNF